jgi:ubiquinone/menaquinone biosynthesis C-methylase UbiE
MTISQALAEVRRVLRRGGTAVIIETLGTGRETPQPPSPALAEYYAWLEGEHGFSATWIRTDYRFASLEEAARLTGFFFGVGFAAQVVENRWVDVPECTGIWWRTWD